MYECKTCNRTFSTKHAYKQHTNDTGHLAPLFECKMCTKTFISEDSATQHMNDAEHWTPEIPCETCGKKFYDQMAVSQHMDALNHWAPEISCDTCGRKFRTQKAANRHMRERAHYKNYCAECGVQFQNENSLRMARLSSVLQVCFMLIRFILQHLNWKIHRKTNLTTESVVTDRLETNASSYTLKLSREKIQTPIVPLSKTARKKISEPEAETRTSFMFPSLHQDVVSAVSDEITSTWFHEKDSDRDSYHNHQTHVMGKFKCKKNACSTDGWGSKKVAILIRGYPKNGYNAVVFNQRCKSCNGLGSLTLDENSYVDRVAYRLKKWAGVAIEQRDYASKKGPPHEKDFCEGCKRGVCRQNDWDYY